MINILIYIVIAIAFYFIGRKAAYKTGYYRGKSSGYDLGRSDEAMLTERKIEHAIAITKAELPVIQVPEKTKKSKNKKSK